jgi:hypothetical protein
MRAIQRMDIVYPTNAIGFQQFFRIHSNAFFGEQFHRNNTPDF